MVRVQVLGGVLASEPSLAKWAHRPTGRCRCRKPEIPVRFRVGPLKNTVPWSNGNDAWFTSRKRWFDSIRDYLCPDTPTGRAARLRPEGLQVRFLLWVLETIRPRGAAECSPACHAGDRGFKSHRGRSTWHGAPIRQSDQAQTLVVVGSTPSRATRKTTCVGWALASPSGCNPPASELWRFNSVPAH